VGLAVTTPATPAVVAGELIISGLVTGGSPGSVTAGATGGVGYTVRAKTSSGSSFSQDVLAGAAGGQSGTATLATSTDWYAIAAVFRPATTTPADTQAPSVPTGTQPTTVTTSSIGLSWSPSTDNTAVTGYTIYRGGTPIATTTTTAYTDTAVAPNTTYTYALDAFDATGNHSGQSPGLQVSTPAAADTQAPSVPTGGSYETTPVQVTKPPARDRKRFLAGGFWLFGGGGGPGCVRHGR
jgi:hypothetical protein